MFALFESHVADTVSESSVTYLLFFFYSDIQTRSLLVCRLISRFQFSLRSRSTFLRDKVYLGEGTGINKTKHSFYRLPSCRENILLPFRPSLCFCNMPLHGTFSVFCSAQFQVQARAGTVAQRKRFPHFLWL